MPIHVFKNVATGRTKQMMLSIIELPPIGEEVVIEDGEVHPAEEDTPRALRWYRVMSAPAVQMDTSFRE